MNKDYKIFYAKLINTIALQIVEELTDAEDLELVHATDSELFNLIGREAEKKAKKILKAR